LRDQRFVLQPLAGQLIQYIWGLRKLTIAECELHAGKPNSCDQRTELLRGWAEDFIERVMKAKDFQALDGDSVKELARMQVAKIAQAVF